MKKIVLIVLVIVMVALMFVGCGESKEAVDTKETQYEDREVVRDTGMFEIIYIDGNVKVLIDHETGNHYIITKDGGITERLNSDGTVYTENHN